MTPAELSRAFLDAYNRRDSETMGAMLADDFTYIRPGPVALDGADRVIARYRTDWQTVGATLRVRRLLDVGDDVVMEITIDRPDGVSIEAVVLHQWVEGRLVGYRLYRDPVQPGGGVAG
ncbi:MAG: nuclear transport factor 2 family protein [Acidimicrobiia bacterium]|nr:nuclear transport factor 2 family protein [Acidimicrobiia bacterium]